MIGNWFYIWKISQVGQYDKFLKAIEPYKSGITGFWLKMLDGTKYYNRVNSDLKTVTNDAYLKEWIDAVRAEGYQVNGWGYVLPDQTSLQGDMADERRQKLDIKGWLINAEVEWKGINGANKKAEVYLSKLHKGNFEIGFTSYRYPTLHTNFPFGAWLNEQAVTFNSPQVYWIDMHNPVEQTLRSKREYNNNGWVQPFVPSASAFGVGSWEPTTADLIAMRQHCLSNYGGVVWWSMDWVLLHQKYQWLAAICGTDAIPPQPSGWVETITDVNPRKEPNTNAGTDMGLISPGFKFQTTGPDVNGYAPVTATFYLWRKGLKDI